MAPTDLIVARPLGPGTGVHAAVVLQWGGAVPRDEAGHDHPPALIVASVRARQRREPVVDVALRLLGHAVNDSGRIGQQETPVERMVWRQEASGSVG